MLPCAVATLDRQSDGTYDGYLTVSAEDEEAGSMGKNEDEGEAKDGGDSGKLVICGVPFSPLPVCGTTVSVCASASVFVCLCLGKAGLPAPLHYSEHVVLAGGLQTTRPCNSSALMM